MVCVKENMVHNGPCLIPGYFFLVNKNTLKFYNCERGVGIVQLDGDVVG